jgi:MFS family permease
MGMVTLSFSVAGPAMCMPAMAADLGLDYAAQGVVFSAPMWAFALSVVAAAAADRVGFRVPLVLASIIQAAGWFLLAEAHGFGQAVAAAALAGVGGSVADPLLTPLVCAVYPDRRGRMSNWLHMFYCVGLVLVAVAATALLSVEVSWRWTFRALGLACLPYGAVAAALALPQQTHAGPVRLRTRTLLRDPAFWLVALAMILAAVTEAGPATWLPSLVQSLASPQGTDAGGLLLAGAGLAVFGLLMAAGRFAAGMAATRVGVRRLLAGGAAVCVVGLAAVALPLGPVWPVACLGLVGLAVSWFWPSLLAIAGDRFPRAGASMYSVLSAIGTVGCAAAPLALGGLADAFGRLAPAMALLAVAPAAVLVVMRRMR